MPDPFPQAQLPRLATSLLQFKFRQLLVCLTSACLPASLPARREQRIPVIFDEVFTGFWRLGATSGAQLLGAAPDIACYAKLLTGGLVPLSATLATDDVFKAFEGGCCVRGGLERGSRSWKQQAAGHALQPLSGWLPWQASALL